MVFTILSVVLGAIIAIVITIMVENLRKPKLELRIAPPKDKNYKDQKRPAEKMRSLGIELFNKPLPCWARWMFRNAAIQAHGTITFYHLDGQNVFGRAMHIRWSTSPEPIPMIFSIDDKKISIFDPSRVTLTQRMDIYPGEAERLDIAARFDDENESYGWSNESYFSNPPWRNPDWKLPSGRYIVKVIVISSGEKCTGVFRLINDVAQKDFRIEQALPDDVVYD